MSKAQSPKLYESAGSAHREYFQSLLGPNAQAGPLIAAKVLYELTEDRKLAYLKSNQGAAENYFKQRAKEFNLPELKPINRRTSSSKELEMNQVVWIGLACIVATTLGYAVYKKRPEPHSPTPPPDRKPSPQDINIAFAVHAGVLPKDWKNEHTPNFGSVFTRSVRWRTGTPESWERLPSDDILTMVTERPSSDDDLVVFALTVTGVSSEPTSRSEAASLIRAAAARKEIKFDVYSVVDAERLNEVDLGAK